MARQNTPFLSFNRGLLSPKALARVDLDKTRLSAEVYRNWLPKTTGAMTLRPGTKYMGSTYSDTGAEFIEFVASIDDVALPELTHNKMRVWLGSDPHNLSLLGRPKVDTTLALSDTGWSSTSVGTAFSTPSIDVIPAMTGSTTNGVTVSASSEQTVASQDGANLSAWRAADDNTGTIWVDTGDRFVSSLPSWWKVDFGAGNTKAITSYSLRGGSNAESLDNSPSAWTLQYNDVDTGDGWTTVDSRSAQTGWAVLEKRTFRRLDADTGTVEAFRYWRLNFTAIQTGGDAYLIMPEIEMFTAATAQHVKLQSGRRIFNATTVGSTARLEKRVMVSDTGTEHSLAITVERGPITLRVGSSQRDDDYIGETALGTGYHNLAFTPTGTSFWVTLQSGVLIDRIVSSLSIGDSGTVELTTPWDASDLDNIRYDQSADVVYIDCDGVRPQKIERRGTGRSWSVVDYAPNNGPFLPTASSAAKLQFGYYFGNASLNSDIPLFTADHVGSLVRAFHSGQDGVWRLGADETSTDAIEITGYSDTGGGAGGERQLVISVSGTWAGTAVIERSFDGAEEGFHLADTNFMSNLGSSDSGTFSRTINDLDDNIRVWYRVRVNSHSSGVALVTITYTGGGVTGVARITGYNSNTSVDVEVLSRFSDTGPTDNWQLGHWSEQLGFPASVALHGGRLAHAEGGQLFMSVSDDYENFDDGEVGDAGPVVRTLGAGPVDAIRFLISKLRLLIGTAGAELALTTSSLDEPVTPTNCNARLFSSKGSANVRAVHLDTRAIHVGRAGNRLYMIGPSDAAFGDYASFDLTRLVPDLLAAGVVSIAVQRHPDTRLHCVLGDGTVAILTYEPEEEVVCWSTWSGDTGTSPTVERVAVLPGAGEDAVFYHIRRTINGATKRYLEKWAKESECTGDTGLTWLMDCARSYTDTGRTTALTDIATHLVGESVVVWSDDTGSIPGVDRSPDVNGVQTRYTVDTGGDVTLSTAVHHAVAGLPYKADWRSAKLAYAAEAGTALGQVKRVAQMALIVHQCHNDALKFGGDTGRLDALPRVIHGAAVDADLIHDTLELKAAPFPGTHGTDPRLHIRAKSPRPATVLALIPSVQTNERV